MITKERIAKELEVLRVETKPKPFTMSSLDWTDNFDANFPNGDYLELDIHTYDFPYCCGVTVIGSFSSGPYSAEDKAFFVLSLVNLDAKLVVATTTDSQTRAIELLEYAGFTKAAVTVAENGKQNITLWTLVTKAPLAKPAKPVTKKAPAKKAPSRR